jgi:hypothetical protein
MRSDSHKLLRGKSPRMPQKTGFYLVAIHSKAISEFLAAFQIAYFDKTSGRFQTEEYQPAEGTMEPIDITDIHTGWWDLPSRRERC